MATVINSIVNVSNPEAVAKQRELRLQARKDEVRAREQANKQLTAEIMAISKAEGVDYKTAAIAYARRKHGVARA